MSKQRVSRLTWFGILAAGLYAFYLGRMTPADAVGSTSWTCSISTVSGYGSGASSAEATLTAQLHTDLECSLFAGGDLPVYGCCSGPWCTASGYEDVWDASCDANPFIKTYCAFCNES